MNSMLQKLRNHAFVVPASAGPGESGYRLKAEPQTPQPTLLGRIPSFISLLLLLCLALPAAAKTSNGNDFALYYSEGRDDSERADLLKDAKNRPHYFRYLQIMEMQEFERNGRKGVAIVAFEPASQMDIRFSVTKSVSMSMLARDPKSKRGDAIAVTGAVLNADHEKNYIELGDSIVRHKDRLSPKIGKELLCEVDPGAVFYNYTAGSRPITLTYEDRDLIRHKDRIVGESGADGWVAFLEKEVAKRKRARAAASGGNE